MYEDMWRVSENGCWEWSRGTSNGYGMIWKDGRSQRAHRVVYECAMGPIPKRLVLHHKCENRLCVNPDHLEVTTKSGHALIHEINVHHDKLCDKGHPLTTIFSSSLGRYRSKCVTCMREYQREYARNYRREKACGKQRESPS